MDAVTHLAQPGTSYSGATVVLMLRVYCIPMQDLASRLAKADSLLAPFAVKNGNGLGREFPDSPDATRFPFQRDRDRIIHTQAFRRLKGKTQVFLSGHGDHYRTRITHTLEVAQISRDIARTLGLNEDLAEAIALAHDLGHTPFGHAGEEAMSNCLKPFGKRFEHNEQSLRIVTVLEDRTSRYHGLNLSKEILQGLKKHPTAPDGGLRRASHSLSLEAQIVNLADEIAYTAHDSDDGLRAGQFSMNDIQKTKLGSMALEKSKNNKTEIRGAIVDVLVTDLYEATNAMIAKLKIQSLDDVYAATQLLAVFSDAITASLAELRKFLWDHLYKSEAVQTQAKRGQEIIQELFAAYLQSPPEKVLELQKRTGSALAEGIKDYIAGMTDEYAVHAHEGLIDGSK